MMGSAKADGKGHKPECPCAFCSRSRSRLSFGDQEKSRLNIVIPKALKECCQRIAAQRGETLSDIVRGYLEETQRSYGMKTETINAEWMAQSGLVQTSANPSLSEYQEAADSFRTFLEIHEGAEWKGGDRWEIQDIDKATSAWLDSLNART